MVSNIIYDDTELFCTLHKQISIAVILGKQNKTVKSIEQEKNTIRHTWPILSLNLYHSNSSISPGAQGHYNYELKASTSALMCWKSDRNLGRGSFLCQSHFKTAGCERRRRSKPYPAKKKKSFKAQASMTKAWLKNLRIFTSVYYRCGAVKILNLPVLVSDCCKRPYNDTEKGRAL